MIDVPCIVLAGSLGTRLQSAVAEVPNGLASVHDRPFLAYQIESLAQRGVSRFLAARGYGSALIGNWAHRWAESPALQRVSEEQALCRAVPSPMRWMLAA